MSVRTTIAISAAALALAACGSRTEITANNESAADTNGTAAMDAPVGPAQAFANAAAASDAYEIETSRMALTNSSSAAVKRFAQAMIDAHTTSTANLNSAATQASITLAPALDTEQNAHLADLRGRSGAQFDAAYIDVQKAAHRRTLDALRAYATSGDSAPLKAFATAQVPVVTGHLNMANGLRP